MEFDHFKWRWITFNQVLHVFGRERISLVSHIVLQIESFWNEGHLSDCFLCFGAWWRIRNGFWRQSDGLRRRETSDSFLNHLVASGCCSSVKTNSNTRFSWGSIVVSNMCGGGRTLWVVQLDSTRTLCVTVAVRPLRSILEEKCLAWLVLEAVCSQCSLSRQAARSSWTEPRADSWVAGPTANWAIS